MVTFNLFITVHLNYTYFFYMKKRNFLCMDTVTL